MSFSPRDPGPERAREVQIPVRSAVLQGDVRLPDSAHGIVIFAHGSGSGRYSPRNQSVAGALREADLATLLFDLLTPEEEKDRAAVFDVELLATRLARVSPLRLYYRGSVVREAAAETGAAREKLQAGCELVGVEGAEGDAEILELAAQSLRVLGLAGNAARIAVGNVDYFSALIEAARISPRLARALTDAIDRKDLPGLTLLCTREVPAGKARDALLMLAQPPRPQAEASALLSRAQELAPDDDSAAALRRLASALQVAQARSLGAELEVDLGEVRGLGYYTGLVFNLYAEGAPRVVGGGGRYDKLLGRFGDPRPAVGFSLDLDALVPLARPA